MSLRASKLRPAYDAIKTLVNISGSQGLLFAAAGGALTNGRTSTATIEDHEGVIRDCKIGEIRYANARRVENLFTNTSFATNLAGWGGSNGSESTIANPGSLPKDAVNSAKTTIVSGQTNGVFNQAVTLVPGRKYRFTVWVFVPIGVSAGAAKLAIYYVNVSWFGVGADVGEMIVERDLWVRKSITFTANSTYPLHVVGIGLLGSPAGTFTYACLPLLEDITNQINQSPSEPIDSDVIHNAGVPGVKYFDYKNGNTVTGGVVTEARGADLPMVMLHEGLSTNLISKSVASATNWNPTNSGPTTDLALNALGQFPGVEVTSQGGSWHRLVAPTMSVTESVKYCVTAWYKAGTSGRARVTMRDNMATVESNVNGTVGDLATTSNSAGTAVILSQDVFGDVYRVQIAFTPLYTTSSFQLAIGPDSAVTGESVVALGAQMEVGDRPTSYIPTSTTAVTRAADNIKLPYAPDGNLLNQSGFILMKFVYGAGPSDNDQNNGIFTTDGSGPIYKYGSSGGTLSYKDKNNNGNASWSVIGARNQTVLLAFYWSLREGMSMSVSIDGGVWQHHTTQSFAGMSPGSYIELFKNSKFTQQIQTLKIYSGLPGKTLERAKTWIETNAFAQVQ